MVFFLKSLKSVEKLTSLTYICTQLTCSNPKRTLSDTDYFLPLFLSLSFNTALTFPLFLGLAWWMYISRPLLTTLQV